MARIRRRTLDEYRVITARAREAALRDLAGTPPTNLDGIGAEAADPTFVPLENMEVFQTTPERNAANMAAIATPATPLVTGDPVYERQASLGLQSPSVMIVGCGGVGVWVALALALGGVERLSLWDGDTLSQNNLNRFPLPPSLVGEMKSVALAGWLSSLRPGVEEIRARGEFDPLLHNESPESYMNWLVCATDSLKSRKMCYAFAKEKGMHYIEVGADGERWSLSPAPPEFSTEGEDAPGYRSVPVHVGPCMMAGAAVAYHVLHNKTPLYTHTGNWDKGPVMDNHRQNLASLDFISLSEENIPEVTASHKCPYCQRPVEDGIAVISLIKHLREDKPEWGLVEAKTEAERLMREWGTFVAPAQVRQTTVNLAERYDVILPREGGIVRTAGFTTDMIRRWYPDSGIANLDADAEPSFYLYGENVPLRTPNELITGLPIITDQRFNSLMAGMDHGRFMRIADQAYLNNNGRPPSRINLEDAYIFITGETWQNTVEFQELDREHIEEEEE